MSHVFVVLSGTISRLKYRSDDSCVSVGVGERGDWLGLAEVLGSYTWFEGYIDRLSAVTVDDVQRVAQTHLKPSNRTVGWYVPN